MPDQKQKGPLVLEHQTDREEITYNRIIPQPRLLDKVCDADLAVIDGDIEYARHLIHVGDYYPYCLSMT